MGALREIALQEGAATAEGLEKAARQGPGTAAQEVLVLDFGGQYSQLIARRVRECGAFAELLPHDTPIEDLQARSPRGLILSGGPASVYEEGAPSLRPELLELGVPVLGICYGMQAMVLALGGRLESAPVGEFGRSSLTVHEPGILLAGSCASTRKGSRTASAGSRLHRRLKDAANATPSVTCSSRLGGEEATAGRARRGGTRLPRPRRSPGRIA